LLPLSLFDPDAADGVVDVGATFEGHEDAQQQASLPRREHLRQKGVENRVPDVWREDAHVSNIEGAQNLKMLT
jgi:hypothetical protein